MLKLSVSPQFKSPLIRGVILFLIAFSIVSGQEQDSTQYKTPSEAVKRALLFPGGGQFYNDQPFKGSLLVAGAIGSAFLYLDNSNKYSNFSGEDLSQKGEYLKLRNKYGWWIGIVYIYGLLDAIVEAHLHPFNDVMSEDLEQPKTEDKEENESKS